MDGSYAHHYPTYSVCAGPGSRVIPYRIFDNMALYTILGGTFVLTVKYQDLLEPGNYLKLKNNNTVHFDNFKCQIGTLLTMFNSSIISLFSDSILVCQIS